MRKTHTVIFVILILLSTDRAQAQQKAKPFPQLKMLSEWLEGKDQLKTNLQMIKQNIEINEADDYSKKLGVDIETAKKLIKLRNPFKNQLPIPETEAKAEPPLEPPKVIETLPPSPENRPLVAPPMANQYNLTGLVWNTDYPQAILNGKIITVGERIDQWTITAISKKGVALTAQNQTFWIEPKGARNGQ